MNVLVAGAGLAVLDRDGGAPWCSELHFVGVHIFGTRSSSLLYAAAADSIARG